MPEILKSGTEAFEKVFGFKSDGFTPPAQQFPKQLEGSLNDYGIKNLDKPFFRMRHLGAGKYKREFNVSKRDIRLGLNILVRNVVFEPIEGNSDHIGKAMKQIEAAFLWHKAANISSHRVNYCGHIEPANREKGLNSLKILLQNIVKKWPEVEFISSAELGELIEKN
jgi:hypothetical protein